MLIILQVSSINALLYNENNIFVLNRDLPLFFSKEKTSNSGLTGLEPATSAVTGQCSNQLNYNPYSFFSRILIYNIKYYILFYQKLFSVSILSKK